jgi:hypothetical protein
VSTTTISRATGLAMLGGGLWILLPVVSAVASPNDAPYGSLSFIAVVASFWIFGVLPPALLAASATMLRRALAGTGRVGLTGVVVAVVGYAAMALGNGIEIGSISAGGGESGFGHTIFLIGFLISAVGGIVTGVVLFRRHRSALARTAALLPALALPLGIGIAAAGSAIAPNSDVFFWAGIVVPTGIAWVLLGRSLRTTGAVASSPEYAAVS